LRRHGPADFFRGGYQGRVVQKHIGLRNPALYDLEVRVSADMPVQARWKPLKTGQVFLSNAKNAPRFPASISQSFRRTEKTALREMNETSAVAAAS